MNKCKFCQNEKAMHNTEATASLVMLVPHIDSSPFIEIVFDDDANTHTFNINFCPKCGRNLLEDKEHE